MGQRIAIAMSDSVLRWMFWLCFSDNEWHGLCLRSVCCSPFHTQIRKVRSEQLQIDLENLLHQWPQLVKSFCQGKCPVSFLHSEVGWACVAGILTSSWILGASLLVFMQGGPPGIFLVCMLMLVLNVVVCLRAHSVPAYFEGTILLCLQNLLGVLLVRNLSCALDKS